MLLHVHPSPTTASPPAAQIQAIVADVGRVDRDGVAVLTSDGLRIALAGDDGQSNSALGPTEQPREPPPDPGTEPRLTTDPTGVAAHCEAVQQTFAKSGWKIVRRVVSRNAQFGVVWRADVAMPRYGSELSRVICWRIPGRAGYSISVRPLEMFDPSASIPPLAP